MPFDLCNAPATFQRLMQVVLSDLEWDSCFVYIDDIMVASALFEEHLSHLREVFNRLRKACLRLKPKNFLSKCRTYDMLFQLLGSSQIVLRWEKSSAIPFLLMLQK